MTFRHETKLRIGTHTYIQYAILNIEMVLSYETIVSFINDLRSHCNPHPNPKPHPHPNQPILSLTLT